MPPRQKPSSNDEKIDAMYDAMFIGDGKVGGAPGLVEAMNQARAEIADLKGQQNKTADRAWALGLGAVAGVVGSYLKGLFGQQ